MKFFIDTANIEEIKQALSWGVLDGVTTNPSLIAKEEKPFNEVVQEICKCVPGPVSLETVATTTEQMIIDGKELAKIADNVVVKLPTCLEALQATKVLAKDGIRVNMTLCFSPLQGLLAAKAGAAYISPFVGRLDDIGQNGMELISQLTQIYENYGFETEVLVASIRNPIHVLEAALMGADVATIPFRVMEQFIKHPLTDRGIETFLNDSKKVPAA
ncbi:MAG: fructose-6-phosphate aldolase [Bdellovibrionales bacterium]|nr:fructose-6-phosphate aldolase [Bdellovibrionales bacterium]